jgi:hypothetical protein
VVSSIAFTGASNLITERCCPDFSILKTRRPVAAAISQLHFLPPQQLFFLRLDLGLGFILGSWVWALGTPTVPPAMVGARGCTGDAYGDPGAKYDDAYSGDAMRMRCAQRRGSADQQGDDAYSGSAMQTEYDGACSGDAMRMMPTTMVQCGSV